MLTPDRSTLLNEADAAAMLRVSPNTLRTWRATGNPPPYRKFGTRVVYELSDLQQWIAAQPKHNTGTTGA